MKISARLFADKLPYLVFLILSVYSFWQVLSAPGIIGHTWDWAPPAFPEQAWLQTQSKFWIWDDLNGTGSYNPLATFQYLVLVLPLSLLGGEFYTKAILILLPVVAATAMFLLATKGLCLPTQWSLLAAFLFMLSPIAYSRLVAGHVNILLGHALLPLLALFCVQTIRAAREENRLHVPSIIGAGLVLGYDLPLRNIFVLGTFMVAAFFATGWMRAQVWRMFCSGVCFFLIAILLNLSWLVPFGISYFSTGSLGHGYVSGALATLATEFSDRQILWEFTSRPVEQALRLFSVTGVRIEYINPLQGTPAAFWMLVSFMFVIGGFALLLKRKQLSFIPLALIGTWLIGTTLVAGARILPGIVMADALRKLAAPVWAEFGNTTRAFPLVALAIAACAPMAGHMLFEQMAVRRGGGNLNQRRALAATSALIATLAGIWALPFLSGAISQPIWMNNEPLALKVYTVKPDDRAVYDFLRAAPQGARMTVAPPPWLGWNDRVDWGWTWEIGEPPPLAKFFAPPLNPFAWQSAADFSSPDGNDSKGKLLALAAVKYVVYPYQIFFEELRDVFPNQPGQDAERERFRERFAPSKSAYDVTLASQTDLKPLALNIPGVTVFENQDYLPRVYAAPSATMVLGSSDYLAPLARTPYFQKIPALFFSTQMPATNAARLLKQSEDILNTFDTFPSDFEPARERPPANDLASQNLTLPDAAIQISTPPKNSSAYSGVFANTTSRAYSVHVNVIPQLSDIVAGQMVYLNAEKYADEVPRAAQWRAAQTALSVVDEYHWSSAAPYARQLSVKNLQIRMRLDSFETEPFVQFGKALPPFDLRDYPNLIVIAQVDNPKTQLVEFRFDLDWNNDGGVDTVWQLPLLPETALKSARLDLLSAAREAFPQQKEFRVLSASVRLVRRPKAEPKDLLPDLYSFTFNQIGFESNDAKRVIPFLSVDAATASAASLSVRTTLDLGGVAVTLPATDREITTNLTGVLADFPTRDGSRLNLAYRLDSPAALVLDLDLVGNDPSNNRWRMPLGTRVLTPFSEGGLSYSVGNISPQIRVARLEISLSKLQPSSELRAITLELGRLQLYQRKPASIPQPTPPILKIDDRPVALSVMTPAERRTGTWYSSSPIQLTAGSHTIDLGYVDPKISDRIELVELAPEISQPVPAGSVPSVSFRQINPTRYWVRVENATAPFYLIASNTFHSEWKAFVVSDPTAARAPNTTPWYEQSALLTLLFREAQRAEIPQHDIVNGFANSWYVERTGTFDIEIEFLPQRVYEGGLIVFLITLIACVCAVLVANRKRAGEGS